MLEIVMVRHGHPEWEPDGRAVDDPDLSGLGRTQAERLARALEGERFDYFYVSPLRRALQTAEPVARVLGMEPEVLSWLEELRTPRLEGSPTEQVRAFLDQARARALDEWWDGIPGGESFRHFQDRVTGGLEPLLDEAHRARVHAQGASRIWHIPADSQRILVVAHCGTISVMISHLLGIEPVPWSWERFVIYWAGYSVVRSNALAGGAIWALHRLNVVEHLKGLDVPRH